MANQEPAEVVPEMLEAGVEALAECRHRQMDDGNTCVAIYLAMEAIREIAVMKRVQETVH